MTMATRRPLVRPRFATWSLAIAILLLPFVIHAVWDYIAARRLKATIDGIAANREPVAVTDIDRYQILSSEAVRAARYYIAAGILASEHGAQNTPILLERTRAVQDAIVSGRLSDETLATLRDIVEDYHEPLELVDRSTPLIFEGFVFFDYSYRWSNVQRLVSLAGMRTELLIHDRAGDRAAESLNAEIQLLRPFESSAPSLMWFGFAGALPPMMTRLSRILEEADPSTPLLDKLARHVQTLDRDDRLKQSLLYRRAMTIDIGMSLLGSYYGGTARRIPRSPGFLGTAVRPWIADRLRESLDTFAEQIAAADRPWPSRIDAVDAVPRRALPTKTMPRLSGIEVDDSRARMIADGTALLRCGLVALAVERYRRDHGGTPPTTISDLAPQYLRTLPIDPFSGEPMKFIAADGGYKIYSVGTNRKDDGGKFDGSELLGRDAIKRLDAAADFGLRIQTRHR